MRTDKMQKVNDEIIRSFNRLKGLKDNLPGIVKNSYVGEYHEILTKIESSGSLKLDEFKIPSSEVEPHTLGRDREGNRRYSENKYCDRSFFLCKLDALLYYLANLFSDLNIQ